MNSNIVPLPELTTVQLISNARRALAEARTLPDFRRVEQAAKVAADAAKRAAKLMEAEGVAAEVVKLANEAANDAAAVRIEAQAGAGRILRQMRVDGELAGRGNRTGRNQFSEETTLPAGIPKSLPEIGVDDHDASRWQRVADVDEGVRADYVDATKADGGEITTAGLLRFAAAQQATGRPVDEPDVNTELERAYSAVADAMTTLAQFRNAGAIAAYAADSRRKSRFRGLVARTRAWVEEAEAVLE